MADAMQAEFGDLRDAVQDAWNDQYTVDQLNRTLALYEYAAVNPLHQQKPDAHSRQQIQAQKVRLPGETNEITLNTEVVAWTLEFSDAVELNEVEVVKLLVKAFKMSHDDPRRCATEKETAINLYFSQRSNLLVALLDIVQMVDATSDFDPRLVRITQSYVQRLREKGLVQNIISRIKDLLRMKSSVYRKHLDEEVRQLALILFYLQQSVGLDLHRDAADAPNVKAVIQLTDEMSQQIPKTIRSDQERSEVVEHIHSITTTVYLLIITVMKAMIHPPVGDVSSRIQYPRWASCAGSALRSSYELVWCLSAGASSTMPSPQNLIETVLEGCNGFNAFLARAHILPEKAVIDLAEVCSEFMLELLKHHLDTIKFTPSDPGRVLSVIGCTVQLLSKHAPELVYKFWSSRSFCDFLSALDALTPLTSSRFSSYISLVSSLCFGNAAHRAFAFIASAKNTNWHRVFDLFQRAVRDVQPPQQSQQQRKASHMFGQPSVIETAPVSALPPMDIQILCDLLALVEAMAANSSSANSLALQHFSALDTLFMMLACSFPVRLKAAIVSCLHAWARGRPTDVSLLWERIEAAQILPTFSSPSAPAGPKALLRDLEVVESRDGVYPLSLAFLRLLNAMVACAPSSLLARLGAPLRRGGPSPYALFARDDVLSKMQGRRFVSEQHRFEVHTAALRVLNAFAVSSNEDAVTVVLEPLMHRQRDLFTSVISVLDSTSTFLNSIDANSDAAVIGSAREALTEALKLLSLGCAHEERISAKMARSTLESTPLSTLLLRHPNAVVLVCDAISRPSASLQLYAARVLLALALRDATLVVRVLGSLDRLDVVRRAVASQLRGLHASSSDEMDTKKRFVATLLQVLVETLRFPYPTLSHVLLGFASTTSAGESRVEHGHDGCLVALLHLVRKPCFMRVFPELAQLCLRLFYRLLDDARTSRAFLAYLSLHEDVFATCLRSLPLLQSHEIASDVVDPASTLYHYLLQLAWLLKALALEQHLRRGYRMVESSGPSALHVLGLHAQDSASTDVPLQHNNAHVQPLLMVEVLEAVRPRLSADLPPFGGLDRSTCVSIGKGTLAACVERVGDAVLYEQGSVDAAPKVGGAGADEFLWRIDTLYEAAVNVGLDPTSVVRAAAAFNDNVKVLAASRAALEGWKQLVQVWLYEREPAELELGLELQLLSAVLDKLRDPAWKPVVVGLSALALSLMAHIRIHAPLLAGQPSYRLDHRILQKTMAGIVENASHVARGHLYGVFYTFTEFMREVEHQWPSSVSTSTNVGGSYADVQPRGHDYLLTQALAELNLSPAHLLKRACADAFDGEPSSRALTLLFISAFPLEKALPILERSSQVLRFVHALGVRPAFASGRRGGDDDSSLSAALTDAPIHYHVVLAFESQALLLLHLSRSSAGARALFAADVLGRMFESGFIDARPPPSSAACSSIHPSALHKYHQMLLPCLDVVVSLLVAMPHRHDLHERVVDLLLSPNENCHRRAFFETLRVPDSVNPPMFQLEALRASSSILLLLSNGPLQDRSELNAAFDILMKRLPELAFTFRRASSRSVRGASLSSGTRLDSGVDEHGEVIDVNEEGVQRQRQEKRFQLHTTIFREVLSLALNLVQRGQYTLDANLDPKIIRDDVAPSLPVDQPVPVGVIVYYAVKGGLELLKWSAEERSRFEECLDNVLRHRSIQRLPVNLISSLTLPANLSEPQQAAIARKHLLSCLEEAKASHDIAVSIVQRSVQIVFLSLQSVFSSRGSEVEILRRHLDRLKECLDRVEAAFAGKEHDDLVAKQLRHCRYELDSFDPQLSSKAAASLAVSAAPNLLGFSSSRSSP